MATSLAQLITLVRERSNMENNFFISDTELTTYINNSLGELDDVLTTEYEEYRLNNFQAIIPNDGVSNTIAIPSNMNKLRGVDYQLATTSSTLWLTLYPFQFPERNRWNNSLSNVLSPLNRSLSYRLADQGIIITPLTQAYGTYQIWFTPKFYPLLVTTDVLPIQMDTNAWVEYTIVDCCVKIFNKQNLDPSGFMAEKAALLERIRASARNRNSAAPKRIANVRFNDGDMMGMPYFDTW